MKRISVTMVRENLVDIPQYSLPDGFQLRLFSEGDEENWANIETKVDEFENEHQALIRFKEEFGPHIDEMEKRCLFIENEQGETIATTTAWYGDLRGNGKKLVEYIG